MNFSFYDLIQHLTSKDSKLYQALEQLYLGQTSSVLPISVIRKSGDESVTSSTVLINDRDFIVNLVASTKYLLEYNLYLRGANAGGYRFGFYGNLTYNNLKVVAIEYNVVALGVQVSVYEAWSTGSLNANVSTVNPNFIQIKCTIEVRSTGTFIFRWAQANVNATPLKVLRGSHLILSKL